MVAEGKKGKEEGAKDGEGFPSALELAVAGDLTSG